VNQLMLQAGRWGKVWRGGKVQVDCGERPSIKGARPHEERAPLNERAHPYVERAPLNERGSPS
jgi:hypothetical protein